MSDGEYTIRSAEAVADLPAGQWDALTDGANPFMSHAFLSLLEESGSVGGRSGWRPLPIVAEGADGVLAGALPAYVKQHSQGEYVFDHSWADAFHRAGGDYYPKLQIAAPFTPATGPRVLTRNPGLAVPLLQAAEELCRGNGLSSVHATFIEDGQVELFERAGWLIRHDIQFHWERRGYERFDDFLAALSSRKRKDIRKERARAQEGLDIRVLIGGDIRSEHWDAFWAFYQDTGMRKWGTPYLTRAAFALLGERMADRIALVLAYLDGKPVAGALNFIGAHTLFGRYWGALVDRPFLHFELCYYQAIDLAIALRLDRVEAGAQGGHKLARGYEPVRTTSAHFIAHAGFREAVADFLERERKGVAQEQFWLGERTPFRKEG
jgi:predicted N-acyltransferase